LGEGQRAVRKLDARNFHRSFGATLVDGEAHWNLVLGAFLGFGAWDLELGIWSLGFGAWDLELGIWSLGFGAWDLELGIWSFHLPLPLSQLNNRRTPTAIFRMIEAE